MKTNRIIVAVITLVIFAMSTTGAFASSLPTFSHKTSKVKNGYVTKFYANKRYTNAKIKTSKKLKVKVVSEKKVTRKMLRNRKNKYILVVKVNARCIDNNGNGKTSTGRYINYQDCENAYKGQRYVTYLVYGNNNYIDDVISRIDTWKASK